MVPPGRARGLTLLLAVLVLALAFAAVAAISALAPSASRDAASDRALAQAREALVAYAADRNITAWVGPGYLPCPDLDDDGWAEPTCGSQSGDSGQEQRLGRLPWKTLGLPDLRDGHGERLWYAVSSKHKGLLNCAQSRACLDMSPDSALGTLTVRDASGTLVHDGTSTDLYAVDRGGAAAVILAPGPILRRLGEAAEQKRECTAPDCDASGRCVADPPRRAAKCDPANYLDKAPEGARAAEDNADFVDRNDPAGRASNTNGFIQGPVFDAAGRVVVNDRVAVVAYRDLMPRVMRRVALEVAQCLRFYASRPENGGRYPRPAPACRQEINDPALKWSDGRDVLFGRIPDTPFTRTVEESGGRMLERWWRSAAAVPERLAELPTRETACRIAFEPADEGVARRSAAGNPAEEGRTAGLAENAWWTFWKPFVFYAVAPGVAPAGSGRADCTAARCIEVRDARGALMAGDKEVAVIVAGAPLPLAGGSQRHAAAPGDARHWLEGVHADLERANPNPAAPECVADALRAPCDAPSCLRVSVAPAGPAFNDVLATRP
jgi:hypothetical protein